MKVDLSPDVIVLPDAAGEAPLTRPAPRPAGEPRVETAINSVFLVCSTGGHLTQLYALRRWWQDKKRVWVTFDKED